MFFTTQIPKSRGNRYILSDLLETKSVIKTVMFGEKHKSNVQFAYHFESDSIVAILEQTEKHYILNEIFVLMHPFMQQIDFYSPSSIEVEKDKVEFIGFI
jgi:hypothetical protein